jgi:hypothetical protein
MDRKYTIITVVIKKERSMGKWAMGGLLVVVVLSLVCVSPVKAESINFLNYGDEVLQGVDGDTSIWSNNGVTKKLKTYQWSLLNGNAGLNSQGGKLMHTGTKGIGIWGDDSSGIDYGDIASINFNQPYFLNSFSVNSLFTNDFIDKDELGAAKLFLGGNLVKEQTFAGTDNGLVSVLFDDPYIVDRVEFYVPKAFPSHIFSEYSLAGLDVSVLPEPMSTSLFLLGSLTMAMSAYVRKLRI